MKIIGPSILVFRVVAVGVLDRELQTASTWFEDMAMKRRERRALANGKNGHEVVETAYGVAQKV